MIRFLKRFKEGELGLNRIEAFSDSVFAIVLTLLVLALKVSGVCTIMEARASFVDLRHCPNLNYNSAYLPNAYIKNRIAGIEPRFATL